MIYIVSYENDCVDCGLPCFDSCPHKRVPHYYCDECGDEAKIYNWDETGQQLCIRCVEERLEVVQ